MHQDNNDRFLPHLENLVYIIGYIPIMYTNIPEFLHAKAIRTTGDLTFCPFGSASVLRRPNDKISELVRIGTLTRLKTVFYIIRQPATLNSQKNWWPIICMGRV